ncbi:hypothetical protein V8G54_016708 [Vigna mungo]|uniref:HMA domain-containing protein n=1 Tax=Vigna mungo TaxID=3915 RepID=A0AAQ3NNH0_VIGMU
MDLEDGAKSIKNSKGFPLGGSRTSLASMESLSMPQVQEVVLSADMQCENCQRKVTDIITKMNASVCTNAVLLHDHENQRRLQFLLQKIKENHSTDERVCVFGRFEPADVAIKIKKKMNRRVEILEVQEMEAEVENEGE